LGKQIWAKTFTTTLRHMSDFAQPNSMRLVVNGIHLATDLPISRANAKINTLKFKK